MDWKLYTDKYNNRFEHFLSVQIVPVFVQVQKPSLSRGKRLYLNSYIRGCVGDPIISWAVDTYPRICVLCAFAYILERGREYAL